MGVWNWLGDRDAARREPAEVGVVTGCVRSCPLAADRPLGLQGCTPSSHDDPGPSCGRSEDHSAATARELRVHFRRWLFLRKQLLIPGTQCQAPALPAFGTGEARPQPNSKPFTRFTKPAGSVNWPPSSSTAWSMSRPASSSKRVSCAVSMRLSRAWSRFTSRMGTVSGTA